MVYVVWPKVCPHTCRKTLRPIDIPWAHKTEKTIFSLFVTDHKVHEWSRKEKKAPGVGPLLVIDHGMGPNPT